MKSGDRTQEVIAEAMAQRGLRPPTSPPSASPISARPPSSGTGKRACRSRMRWSGRICASAKTSRRCRATAAPTAFAPRPGCRSPLISAASKSLAPRSRPGAREQAEAGDLLFGNIDTFLVWHLTGPPPHRLHQRQPHAVDESGNARLGSATCSAPSTSRARCCRAIRSSQRGATATATLDAVRGVPVAGILGDQQAALVGQTCFTRRRGQKHVRHRMFSADEHRHGDGAVALRAC